METLRDLDVVRALPPLSATEMRADGEGGMPTMVVRFSTFDTWYEIDSMWEGTFLERTVSGAFKRTIKNSGSQVKCLYDHGMDPQVGNKVLGRIESLREEPDSPVGEVPLFDTSYNRDLLPGLEAGVYGSSFRMRVVVDEWNDDPGVSDHNPKGIPERTIKEVRLFEFGPVTFPANPDATASVRSLTDVYYEQLRKRDPDAVEELRSRVTAARTVAAPEPDEKPAEAEPVVEAPTDSPAGTSDPEPAGDGTSEEGPAAESDPAARHSDTPEPVETGEPPTTEQTRSNTVTDNRLSVEEREARTSEIRDRLQAIDAEFAGATLPEDVRSEWDDLNTEIEDHQAAITETRARQERIAALGAGSAVERGSEPAPRGTNRPGARRAENIYDLSQIRQLARSVDDLPGLYRDHALRAVETARFGSGVQREDAQTNIERLLDNVDDEQGTLARSVLVTGSPMYTRAFGKAVQRLSTNGLNAEEQRALSLGTTTAGGFAVPFQLDPTIILTSAGSVNPLRQISRVEQIVGKEWQGITSAGVTVTRKAEAAESDDNSPTIAQPTVKAERVQGFIPFSVEIEQDWNSLLAEMTMLLNDAKEQEESASFVTGTGVSPEANGFITTLAAGSDITANSLTVASLYALEEGLPDRFRDNARFLGHRSIYNLVRQFDTAGGANLWERIGNGQPPELLGYPAHRSSAMADGSLAIGDRYLALGDFSKFLIVDRVGMSVDFVPHLFGATRRPTGQRGLFSLWRNNSKVLVDNAFRVLKKIA